MSKDRPRLSRLGVLAPAALSACIDASVLAAPAAGAILSTVLKELSKAFMLKKWFHGVMTAEEAEHLLLQRGKNGSYLVRESQTHPGEFVLSVRVRGRVSHVMIRREHNKYNVGSGEIFDDLTGLIEHCRAYPLTETSGDVLRLLQPVSGTRMTAPNIQQAVRELKCAEQMDVDTPGAEKAAKAFASIEPIVGNGFYGDFIGGSVENEYKALKLVEASSSFTTIEGLRRENEYKNRYKNVIPYDQTRVVLPPSSFTFEDNCSDYINASYIRPLQIFEKTSAGSSPTASNESLYSAKSLYLPSTGSAETVPLVSKSLSEEALREARRSIRMDNANGNRTPPGVVKDKFYIATQGCLRTTTHSFWNMIVQHDIRVIAMITNQLENGKKKCERYWPLVDEHERYGDIQVNTVQESSHLNYTFREFEVKTENKSTTVYQYQFRTWPDHEAPAETKDVLTYLHDINERMLMISNGDKPPKNNILCVHCSAGIGRTGTFIALDMLIDQVKVGGLDVHIDIHNTVKMCRFQRAGMVQNKLQYKFLYLAMNEYLEGAKAKAKKDDYYGAGADFSHDF